MNKKTKKYILIISILTVIVYQILTKKEDYIESNTNSNILISYQENNRLKEENKTNKIVIYITGAVKNEGIYEIEENSRIADCIEESGGLTEEANIDNINLAYIVQDGMKIHIPKKGENTNNIIDNTNEYITKENDKETNKSDKININTATQTELERLPGIGSSTATKIIDYRKQKGKFSSIEEIKEVNGIGENKYSKIKDLITI